MYKYIPTQYNYVKSDSLCVGGRSQYFPPVLSKLCRNAHELQLETSASGIFGKTLPPFSRVGEFQLPYPSLPLLLLATPSFVKYYTVIRN